MVYDQKVLVHGQLILPKTWSESHVIPSMWFPLPVLETPEVLEAMRLIKCQGMKNKLHLKSPGKAGKCLTSVNLRGSISNS